MTRHRQLQLSWIIAITVGAIFAWPATGAAHPLIDQAQERFDAADFEGALAKFAAAENADDLDRDDLIELYRRRAMVHHTLGNEVDLEQDLLRLATLEPGFEFDAATPPIVQNVFRQAARNLAGPLTIRVIATAGPGVVRISARVDNDLGALVQSIRIGARTAGGAFRNAENEALNLPTTSDSMIDYYAIAVGPGGAIVANSGSRESPVRSSVDELVRGATDDTATGNDQILDDGNGPHRDPDEDAGGIGPWPFVIGGAVAVAGGVALAILLAGQGSTNTVLSPPQLQ